MSNPRGSDLIKLIIGLFIGLVLSSIRNLFNSPLQAQGVSTMTNETFVAILLFIGAIVAGVLWLLDSTNRRLGDSLPPQLLPLLAVALDALATLAKQTETPLDDELIQRLKDALSSPSPTQLQRLSTVKPESFPEAG